MTRFINRFERYVVPFLRTDVRASVIGPTRAHQAKTKIMDGSILYMISGTMAVRAVLISAPDMHVIQAEFNTRDIRRLELHVYNNSGICDWLPRDQFSRARLHSLIIPDKTIQPKTSVSIPHIQELKSLKYLYANITAAIRGGLHAGHIQLHKLVLDGGELAAIGPHPVDLTYMREIHYRPRCSMNVNDFKYVCASSQVVSLSMGNRSMIMDFNMLPASITALDLGVSSLFIDDDFKDLPRGLRSLKLGDYSSVDGRGFEYAPALERLNLGHYSRVRKLDTKKFSGLIELVVGDTSKLCAGPLPAVRHLVVGNSITDAHMFYLPDNILQLTINSEKISALGFTKELPQLRILVLGTPAPSDVALANIMARAPALRVVVFVSRTAMVSDYLRRHLLRANIICMHKEADEYYSRLMWE